MDESINIASTKDSTNTYYNSPNSANIPKKQAEIKEFHIGDIIRGIVLEKIDKDNVVISLPNGNFNATVRGNLVKNDSLYFKVEQLIPNLILKINEIKVTKEQSIDDLIRIFDLPNESLYKNILEVFKENKPSINKDYLFAVIAAYNSLSEILKKSKSPTSLAKVIIKLMDNGLPVESNLVEKLAPLFSSEDRLSDALVGLNDTLDNLPYELQRQFKEKLNNLLNNYSIDLALEFLSLNVDDNNSFFNLLLKATKLEDKNNFQYMKARSYSKLLLSTIEAVSLWNAVNSQKEKEYHVLLPFKIGNELSLIRLILKKELTNSNEPLEFSFTYMSEVLSNIKTNVIASDNEVDINIQAETISTRELLNDSLNQIKQLLTEAHYVVQSILTSKLQTLEKNNNPSSNHLTVVV